MMESAISANADDPMQAPERQGSSIVHRVDHDAGVVFVTASGSITADALRDAYQALAADPKFSGGMDVLVECRVPTALPTPEELRSLALASIIHKAMARHGRVAIVATTARSYDAAGIFELFCEASPDRLAIFTDRLAAHAWLGIGRTATTTR